jgi:hypothetical protein
LVILGTLGISLWFLLVYSNSYFHKLKLKLWKFSAIQIIFA